MKQPQFKGYYTQTSELSEKLVFTRAPKRRITAAITLTMVGLGLLAIAVYSLTRQSPDMTGFTVLLLAGIGAIGLAVYSFSFWNEIEFNRSHRQVIKRRYLLGRMWSCRKLSFDDVKRVNVVVTYGEFDSFRVQVMASARTAWVTLPGYLVENQARQIQKKIKDFIETATPPVPQ